MVKEWGWNELCLCGHFDTFWRVRAVEFSWTIFLLVFATNGLLVFLMYVAQLLDKNLPPRHSLIPGTNQKFLYMQDWWLMSLGDLISIPLIANAFFHLCMSRYIESWEWPVFVVIAIASTTGFMAMCLRKKHKPDAGFPATRRVGLNGWAHLPYFGTGVAASSACLWHLFLGEISGIVLWLGLAGGALYVIALLADFYRGNFDSIKMK